jgi:NitT/TauT family transport system substrate-binding protein
MKSLHAFVVGLGLVAAAVAPSTGLAQTRMTVGYTATIDTVPMFAAIEKGMFAKRGVEVTPQPVAVNSLLPAALVSNSIQLGMTTVTTFLQATDAGLDLVAVSGLNFTRKDETNFGVVTRNGSGISKASDFIGRKVGVPGLNAFLHVLFVDWVKRQGADPGKITFVETPFPQMNEIMKSGSVDAVVAAEPFQNRIIQAGTGTMHAHFVQTAGLPIVVFAATRDWAGKNAAAVKGFRDGMAEGMTWALATQDEAREMAARNLKLPIEIVRTLQMPVFGVEVKADQLRAWSGIMQEQKMLTREVQADRLIVN